MKSILKITLIKVLFVIMTIFAIVCEPANMTVCAQEDALHDREVVIVLDCSKSMEDIDNQYLAFDFVKGLAATLPRNIHIGFVAYNNEICACLPIGSSSKEIEETLEGLRYRQYGNAGAGMNAAVELFRDIRTEQSIILISDGEILMDSPEKTENSYELFSKAVSDARDRNIVVDVITFGEEIQEGHTVYSAAGDTGGKLYEIDSTERLSDYIGKYLFEIWGVKGSHIGKLSGMSAEMNAELPDCIMGKAKLILLGEQQNENMAVNCRADKIDVLKGKKYTVVEINNPVSTDIQLHMYSDKAMQVDAYLFAEYDFAVDTGHFYDDETHTAHIWVDIVDLKGHSLLGKCLGDDSVEIYIDGAKAEYIMREGKAWTERGYNQSTTAEIEARINDPVGNYYGSHNAKEEIIVRVPDGNKKQADWFFWSVITLFIISITVIFYIANRRNKSQQKAVRRVTDVSVAVPLESTAHKSDFNGKIVIYVIHNKNDIDYPPESINLFTGCRQDSITLEWILDTCSLPLNLKGADKIIFKPGTDRSLIVKNNSRAGVLIGKSLLTRGQSYNLYYHEKVTFIFDNEDTEIEVHYKDLKPYERGGKE